MGDENQDPDVDEMDVENQDPDVLGRPEAPELEATEAKGLVMVSEVLPDRIPILPVSPRPLFPNMMVPMAFPGGGFVELVKHAQEKFSGILGLVLVKQIDDEDFFASELVEVGTVVRIFRVHQTDEETQVLVRGLRRFTRVRTAHLKPLVWEVKYDYEGSTKPSPQLKPHVLAIMASVKELLQINPLLQEQLKLLLSQMTYDKPDVILDLVSAILTADPQKLQELLETFDLLARSEKLLLLLKEEIEVFRAQDDIQKQISEKVGAQQKEFFLREQLKAIKKELGLEKDDQAQEIEKFEARLKDLTLSEEAEGVVAEEIEKLRMIDSHSPEYHVSRNYLNELTSLPWGVFSEDNLDIARARTILDDDHYGLDDVKKRILEFISTIVKRGAVSGSIICLVGPPGVGKTSVGRSIANALGRKFYRFSVGGMRDEAEIKGHRRTYIGAMPGKIIQSLKQTRTANPVIMIDEIDKVGMSYQGDPASALLEVLDPEQNREFLDHYLDVRFDLSNILFVTTANQLDTIPRPLLDRMEVITLAGYILDEKTEIARRYLIPRQMEEHGLKPGEVSIGKPALRRIVDRYAREAGVRSLENQLKKILRQVTLRQAEGDTAKVTVTTKNVEEFLGKPAFATEELYEKSIPGVALGLAWTPMGGVTLYIESSAVKAQRGFKQTGQLGDVMLESSEIAYSYVRSLLSTDEKHATFFDEHYVHLHVPAGATPKDGPSAGITMALALYSLIIGKPVRKRLAMTGELTLTGRVLAIGGVREKTLAARRVKVKELILPGDNRKDFDELPDYIREGLTVHFVSYFDDVLGLIYPRRR